MDAGPSPDESLDLLAGTWRILQLVRGHRFSTDDLVCAWRASLARPDADRVLDLGCGIGSVGLSTLWRLDRARPGAARLDGVEAQEVSVGLARRTVRVNGLEGRVRIRHADLRGLVDPAFSESELDDLEGRYPLVTGSPPYVPPGRGLLSPVPQRAGARIELRGSVYDYCRAAASRLAPDGRFTFVMASGDPRTEDAPRAAGLDVVERFEVVFREGRAPHICVMTCAPAGGRAGAHTRGTLIVRDRDGRWTDDYLAFRVAMGAGAGSVTVA